jgi:hypothetical protein
MVYDLPVESTKLPVSCLSRTIFWIPKPNTTIATAVINFVDVFLPPSPFHCICYNTYPSNRIVIGRLLQVAPSPLPCLAGYGFALGKGAYHISNRLAVQFEIDCPLVAI